MRRAAMALALAMAAASASAQDGPQVPAGTELVFFDWGKAEVSRDAASILEGVVAAFGQRPGARILLTGHSDRSGPSWANRRAARKRAEAVRAWLVERGILASAIEVAAEGESRPIVPTEDDVREGQNRRVEIRIVG